MSNREIITIDIQTQDAEAIKLQTELEKLNKEIDKLSKQRNINVVALQKLQQQVDNLNIKISHTEKYFNQLNSIKTDTLKKRMEDLNKQLSETDSKIKDTRIELSNLGMQKAKYKIIPQEEIDKLTQVQLKIKEFTTKIQLLKEKMSEETKSATLITKYSNQIDQLDLKMKSFQKEEMEIKVSLEPAKRLEKINEALDISREKLKTLKDEKNNLEKDKLISPENVPELQKINRELDKTSVKILELKARQNDLKGKIALGVDIKKFEKDINDSKQAAENLKKEIKEVSKTEILSERSSKNIIKAKGNLIDLETEYRKVRTSTEKNPIIIQTKTEQAASNLKQAITNINAMESALSSLSPMVSVLEGVGQAMTGLAASAIKEAQEWEMLRIKLGTFYSSVSEATEEFNYLVEMAKTTPFEIKGLVSSAVMLRAFGHDMRSTIQLTGDLAAALGGDVKDASYAVSRALSGASMGFLMLQRTWGISYAKLKALGAEFMTGNRLIAGSIKTQKALLSALQEHSGAMERQSATAAGRLSNLKDAIDTLKESIGQAALPALKTGVDLATKIIDTITNLPGWLKTTAVAVTGITGSLLLLAAGAIKATTTLLEVKAALLSVQLAAASGSIPAVLGKLTSLSGAFGLVKGSVVGLTTSLSAGLTPAIAGSAVALGPLAIAIGVVTAAALGLYYLLKDDGHKIHEQTVIDVDNLRYGLSELRNEYPELHSLTAIFNEDLQKTAEQLAENTDKTYKYKGSLKSLYSESDEDFKKRGDMLVASMGRRLEIIKTSQEQAVADLALIEEQMFSARMSGDTKKHEELMPEKERLDALVEDNKRRIASLTEDIDTQTKKYQDALVIRQKADGMFMEHLTKLSQAEEEEKISDTALIRQKEALDAILAMEEINENVRIDMLNKRMDVINKINQKSEKEQKEMLVKSKEEIKYIKDNWDKFSDYQQIALDKGSISHKQYINNLKQYLIDHQEELIKDGDTRVAIEKEIASEEEKLHKELVDDKIKMDDDYISAKFGADEAAYVKSVATLNKQREDYIQHGNDKIDVDRWYYAQKEQLDYEYYIKQKQNMLKFQEDLAKSQTRKGSFAEERASADADMDKQLLDLEILAKEYEKQNFKKADIDRMVSGERLRIETEHAEKMQDILMKEQQFYEEMYREVLQHYLDMGQLTEAEYLRMQQSILEESVKRHEEAAKVIEKNILAGGEISQQEAEIYKIYTKETKELREINKQLDTRLDSTGKIFETEMDILKQELELKKLRGEISDDKAELTILKYRKDFLDTHKQEFELIKQKRITQGELTADEQEFYKTYQGLLIEQEQGLDTLQKTVSTTDKLTTSTQKATTAAKDLGTSMEKVADSTGKAAEEMKSYGSMMENLGPTLTPDQALGNLPGATSPVSAPTISGRYTTPDYSVNQLRGGARAGGEWDTFFKDMYTELGEQTKAESRRNFEEEMEEKRNHWKREFETVDLNIRGMNDSTSAAMDSMSADINRFSNTPVNVTVNVETTGGGGEGPAGGGALSTPEGQVTDGGEGTTGGGHQGGHTVGADYSSINTSGVGAQSGWSGVNNPFQVPDSYEKVAGTDDLYMTPDNEIVTYDPNYAEVLPALYDTSQNLEHPRIRSVLDEVGKEGFDNPSHDKIAEKLGEKQTQSVLSVIQKNTEDIVKNFLAGTVSAVKQSYNNITNNSKAETRNYYNNKKSLSSAYNISIDNASPVKRVPMRVRNGIEGITDFALKSRFSGGRL
jgi:hypothetical protein